MPASAQTAAASRGRRTSIDGATPVTSPWANPALQPGSLLRGRTSWRSPSVRPPSSAYVRPTVCMTPWQFESTKPPSRLTARSIAPTAGRGSSVPATSCWNSRVTQSRPASPSEAAAPLRGRRPRVGSSPPSCKQDDGRAEHGRGDERRGEKEKGGPEPRAALAFLLLP